MLDDLVREGVGMTSRRTRERLLERLRERGIKNEVVLKVMASTPRHLFVDEALAHRAYEDTALPIGFKQTLSQPYTVARMTEILLEQCARRDSVFEIGTGSGYQTAVLAQLFKRVYTVERIAPLQQKASARLASLNFTNIHYRHADGHDGWSNSGCFDAIIGTAAAADLPAQLPSQLALKGVLIMPVGDDTQNLTLIRRDGEAFASSVVESANFVPLLKGTIS
ncbi:protein-L-isoaspartate(D-aspartate) O-methyltransferase [Marinagarivorans cellulosilyticus]|uniref:Protein-L-isoaspartate O-methyltransferase n=1 Tax=Marinagarivorans cellulosilyticus TaxID=2721545 RepID=A0AAN1WG04_9GAMM|nr:protein-L-isoaspartate(D-aspartate) O-methyltransferase [Marinagarivorans cellulosilyticus]BCD96909.1 protein-L-isoaspartate(D-aspartate) O-methyltransferase [Marinagarivorans cellulosilyticus]